MCNLRHSYGQITKLGLNQMYCIGCEVELRTNGDCVKLWRFLFILLNLDH